MKQAFIATLCLLASACASQQRAEREALLSPQSQELLAKYRQFMTQRQVDEFMRWEDDAARELYVKNLRVDELLAGYSKPIQEAIWKKDVIMGMDKAAVLLSWGTPPNREFAGEGSGNYIERWSYVIENRKLTVVVTNGVVTDVIDEGYSR